MKKNICAVLAAGLAFVLLVSCGVQGSGSSASDNSLSESDSVSTPDSASLSDLSSALEDSASDEVSSSSASDPAALADGTYLAEFSTDSSMFRVNETKDGKGTLTVKDGQMTIHITLMSKKILNLFPGTAEDAQKEGVALLEPTVDTVTYSDGMSEEVFGFDVPVLVIGEEFDLALIGTKGKWYDHKVCVKNPQAQESGLPLADGSYLCEVTLSGGTGKASIESPTVLHVKDGEIWAKIEWSSPNFDYMKVNDVRYDLADTEGNSTFLIPIAALDMPVDVIADTVAMSTPHEVTYTLVFNSRSAALLQD